MADPRTLHAMIEISSTWNGQPIPADEQVRIELASTPDDWIVRIDAPFHGDPAPEAGAGSLEGLWEHEVVELFLLADEERYLEIELGPHGHYLVLVLQGVRQRQQAGLPLDYHVSRKGNRWSGQATVPKAYLLGKARSFNAYAIHGDGTARRYLAAAPVRGRSPDFHRLECFQPLRFS